MTPPDVSALERRLLAPGPKAILSLDGGGTRGVITLAFLERMEAALCGTAPGARLSDHFDLIGGTSTGAIIAAALSLGWRVADIRTLYESFARSVFRRRWYRVSPLVNRYDAGQLEALLERHLGRDDGGADLVLGSPSLRTGLAIVAKRIDTARPWVISNLPRSPYYADRGGPNGNWRIPLRNLVRASAAAPTFFRAVSLPLGPKADGTAEIGRFVDGGASPYNNPVMRLLELARLGCHGLAWAPGKDNLLIVSIGTGRFRAIAEVPGPKTGAIDSLVRAIPQRLLLLEALAVLQSMVGDGSAHALRSLQGLGHTPLPFPVDSEVGDMAHDLLGTEPLFTAIRYDLDLDAAGTDGITSAGVRALGRMDAPDQMEALTSLARETAHRLVDVGHLRLPLGRGTTP